MNACAKRIVLLLSMLAFALVLFPSVAMAAADNITINSLTAFNNRRAALTQHIWGATTINTTDGISSTPSGVSDPLDGGMTPLPPGIVVQRYTINMPNKNGGNIQGIADHFLHCTSTTAPCPATHATKVVIVNQGHGGHYGTFDQMSQLVVELLNEGFDVLGTYMPLCTPVDDSSCGAHGTLFGALRPANNANPFIYFLDPVRRSLNYALATFRYGEVYMAALSGGGWTTAWYAALDPRIQVSVAVAGSEPFYMRASQDEEQNDDPAGGNDNYHFGSVVTGYKDLYFLGSYGHRQIHVLNRNDDCCFGEGEYSGSGDQGVQMPWDKAVREYEMQVRTCVAQLIGTNGGTGELRVEINEADDCGLPLSGPLNGQVVPYNCTSPAFPNKHEFSKNARVGVILAEFNGSHRTIGVASNNVFGRGTEGNLWRNNGVIQGEVWTNTQQPMVGTPAPVFNAVNTFDVFYRKPTNNVINQTNNLGHAFFNGSTWASTNDVQGLVITDPSVISWGPGRIDLFTTGNDYKIYHAAFDGGGWLPLGPNGYELVPTDPYRAVGPVALASAGAQSIDIVFRDHVAVIRRVHYDGSSYSAVDNPDAVIKDFPAATIRAGTGGTLFVYATGLDDQLYEFYPSSGGWLGNNINTVVGASGTAVVGSPSAFSFADGTVNVFARVNGSPFGALGLFQLNNGTWSFSPQGGSTFGSPAAVLNGGAYLLGVGQGLWLRQNQQFFPFGGILER